MPHINDLTTNVIFEGNNGEKWQVTEGLQDKDEIQVKLIRLKVEETLIKE